jgi:protease I
VKDKKIALFVAKLYEQNKLIAAICHGGWMLASAIIVNGIQVTSFFSIRDDLENAGARWVDKEVVMDDNIITSRNPSDLPAFCRAILSSQSQSPGQ